MAGLSTLQSYWNIVTEIDLRPLAREASQEVKLALVGSPLSGRDSLIDQLRRDPLRPGVESDAPVLALDLADGLQARQSDLVILLLDGQQGDFSLEKELARQLADAGKRLLVFVTLPEKPSSPETPLPVLPWRPRYSIYGPPDEPAFLQDKLAAAVIRLLPEKLISLGRNFPLFRIPIARYLIGDTAQSNAAYSLATGLAEIVPILNIPLVITDMLILTKNQAFLAYKLGLLFGFTTEWKSYIGEFGGVLGIGFLWRQFARTLIGLIPGFGIIPKVGVAYAGTVVVGNAVMQWYLTDRHITSKQIKGMYGQAYLKGKSLAGRLMPKLPRRKPKELPEGSTAALPAPKPKAGKHSKKLCPQCRHTSPGDAHFCQYCGHPLDEAPS